MNVDPAEQLFDKSVKALELYRAAEHYIQHLGNVKTEVTKTQVSFGTERKFAWVWLPQLWIKKLPENSIVLTFALDRCIKDKKIKEAVEPTPGKWTHHVVIQKPTDFDEQVRTWILEAWEKSLKASR